MFRSIAFISIILSIPLSGQAATRLVSTSGADTGDCTATACQTIAYAVGQALTNDTIEVAAGLYQSAAGISAGGKTLTFLGAQSGVDARGRTVPEAQESIIDGGSLPSGTNMLSLDGSGSIVDGFILRNNAGAAALITDPSQSGYQVLNNIFSSNGLGLFPGCEGTLPTLVEHNVFKDHTTNQGAFYVDNGSKNITVNENLFEGNSAGTMTFGGVSAGANEDVTITDNEISGGGSIYLLFLDNGTVSGNVVKDFAPSNTHALAIAGSVSDLTVENNLFDGGQGFGIQVLIDSGSANQGIEIHNNNVLNYDGGCLGVDASASSDTVDATNNYWDCQNGAGQPDCTGDSDCVPFLTAPYPETIAVTVSDLSISVGQTSQVIVTGTLADGSSAEVTSECLFTSSDPGVATVDSAGVLSGVAEGSANISVSCFSGDFSGSTAIQVTPAIPTPTPTPTPQLGGDGCSLNPQPVSPGLGTAMMAGLLGFGLYYARRRRSN